MLTNGDLTVYRLAWDPNTKKDGWVRTIVRGVCWQGKTAIQAESGGVQAADYVRVFVPFSSCCAAPCAPEDKVARGIRQELTPPSEAVTVTGVVCHDMGREVMRHWAITAV